MNKKKYLIGSVVVAGACALFALSNIDFSNIGGSYSKKGLSSIQEQKADEAMEWMKARYIDESTGQPVSVEKLQLIQKQIAKISKTKVDLPAPETPVTQTIFSKGTFKSTPLRLNCLPPNSSSQLLFCSTGIFSYPEETFSFPPK